MDAMLDRVGRVIVVEVVDQVVSVGVYSRARDGD